MSDYRAKVRAYNEACNECAEIIDRLERRKAERSSSKFGAVPVVIQEEQIAADNELREARKLMMVANTALKAANQQRS